MMRVDNSVGKGTSGMNKLGSVIDRLNMKLESKDTAALLIFFKLESRGKKNNRAAVLVAVALSIFVGSGDLCWYAWLSGDQPRRLLFTWPSRGVSAPAGSAGHARALVVLPHLLPPSSGFNFLGSALGSPSSLPSSPLFSWSLGGSAAAVAWQ